MGQLVSFRSDRFLESDLVPLQGKASKDSKQAKGWVIQVKLNVELGQRLRNRCWLLIEVKGVVPLCEWVTSSI